jgi:hypothetical protein
MESATMRFPAIRFAWLICAMSLPCAGFLLADSAKDGQALAAELRRARPPEPIEVQGVIRRRDSEGHRHNAPFHYRLMLGSNAWFSVYDTPGGAGVDAQKLTIRHAEDTPNEYRLETTPAGGGETVTITLSGLTAMIPFAGSSFWLADLGLDYLHWPEHRIVEEARIRMRKGRPCRVLESRNPDPAALGYTRVLSWIDRETGKPILAEAYAPDGKLLKEFEVGGVTKVEGVWELKNLEMRDLREDSRTVLEFIYHQKE